MKKSISISLLLLAANLVIAPNQADILRVGTKLPFDAEFTNEDGTKLQSLNSQLGKKTILFVYASW